MPYVPEHTGKDMQVGPDRVPASQWHTNTINRLLIFFLSFKGAKQSIPNNQQAAIVFIYVVGVLRMVHSVIGGADHKPFKDTQLGDMLGMHPELIDQMGAGDTDKHADRHAQKEAGDIKHPGGCKAGAGLTQGGAEVVVFTLVVDHMGTPEKLALMTNSVKPIVEKVIEQYGQ